MKTEDMHDCVKQLGWYPTKDSIREAVEIVDLDGSGSVSFDEFFKMMGHLRITEGFTKAEVASFQAMFDRYDIDGSGEISSMELARCLREQGYPTSLDVLQQIVSEVDVDGSGEIEFSELLKLMRKYRNREMAQAEKLFNEYAQLPGAGEAKKNKFSRSYTANLNQYEISKEDLPSMITKMGWEPQEDTLELATGMVAKTDHHGYLNWTEFLLFMKMYRSLEVDLFNARAGFSVEEVEQYRQTFEEYDKSGDGELSLKELVPVLTALGHEPSTVIQRQKLTAILAEVDQDGSGEIGFDEFLQLMQKFIDESMAEQLLKEKDIIKKTRFDADEVTQWREIFLKFDTDGSGAFDTDEGKVLLQAVGINLNERTMHDRYIQLFHEVDLDKDDAMDFPEFLLMMRRLLDLDFGGIATTMGIKAPDEQEEQQSVADKKKEERRKSREEREDGSPATRGRK